MGVAQRRGPAFVPYSGPRIKPVLSQVEGSGELLIHMSSRQHTAPLPPVQLL